MTKSSKRLVESYDTEYNSLSRTLKMTLVLDEEAIRQVLMTSPSPLHTEHDISDQVLELLDRSIYLNAPRPFKKGVNDK
tara:strand:- start:1563 stop:1799 length:237 start_codon:yes stop_codon:yes gene_type:complete